jgi:hypothetical protein
MPPMTGEETGSYLRHDAAPSVMRRGPPNGLASSGVSPPAVHIIQSCSRKASSLSGGL